LPVAPEDGGRFALASGFAGPERAPEGEVAAELLSAVVDGPAPLDQILASRRHRVAMARLVARGAVQIAAFCPSDAAHVLGLHRAWDGDAAAKAATLFARRRTALGEPLAEDADTISREVVDTLVQRSAETLLDAGFAEDGVGGTKPSGHALVQAALARHTALVRLGISLAVPVISLGASAATYYPRVAGLLNTQAIVPDHADVANAVGAVVGHVRVQAGITISRPDEGVYRTHLDSGPRDFAELDDAVAFSEGVVREEIFRRAAANGASNVEVTLTREETAAAIADRQLFLEMRIVATGVGRPSFS
jgi:N-methylhydantoinase A/oxoprolinase/acetone carboxylase beta subunit